MRTLWQDLRYGARMLLKRPGFTLIAVITLALGIGANTAMFSVVNALLLKQLPYPEPDRLMSVVEANEKPRQSGDNQYWHYPKFVALREQSESFESVAAYHQREFTLTIDGRPEKAQVEIVTANYFPMLGVEALVGRTFVPEEDHTPDTHPVVVLGYGLWQRRFGGDPGVLGKTVYLKSNPFTVVGVAHQDFRGQKGTAELWAPVMMADQLNPGALGKEFPRAIVSWMRVVARLKPNVTVEQAHAEMALVTEKIEHMLPALPAHRRASGEGREFIKLIPFRDTKVDPAVSRAFLILLGSVGLVLLIACANTANLSLMQGVRRRKEFAVRLAMGASRKRIVQQVLAESVLLSLVAGGLAVLIASWGVEWLTSSKPWNAVGFWSQYSTTFDYFSVSVESSVLAFNFLIAFLSGVVVGLGTAWRASGLNVNEMLKETVAASGFHSLRRPSLRNALIVGEIALSLVLLAGAGLMINSFARLMAVKLGFEPDGVLTMKLGIERPVGTTMQRTPRLDLYRELLQRVYSIPGVESAAIASAEPLSGGGSRSSVDIEGQPMASADKPSVNFNMVTPDYFTTFRIGIVKGRGLDERDRIGAPRVAVISHAMAERLWPGEDPLGKRFATPFRAQYSAENWLEVVGVSEDVKYGSVEEPDFPTAYLSAWQPTLDTDTLSIRVGRDPASVISAVRNEIHSLDNTIPVYGVTTMPERVAKVTSRYRYGALLMGMLAGLALLLAATGIYSVMAYAVSGRTRELGIRIALGAEHKQVIRLVIGDGIGLTLAGLGVGVVIALATTRLLASQLYEVRAGDPMTLVIMSGVLISAAILACYVPARRAARVDPMIALRYE